MLHANFLKRHHKKNVKFSSYVGDDDSTTLAELVKQTPYQLQKYSDIIHMKRSLSTHLYNLSQRNKFSNCSILSQKVINYLVKCFSYCVHQNKNNKSELTKHLKCIVPHAFGDHSNCDQSWCRFYTNPETYHHNELPYGKDLHGVELKNALTQIFEEYTTDVVLEKLTPCLNSQRNESLNGTIGSKNIKIRYYGDSSSSDFRLACGIAQRNEGHQYVSKTLTELGIDPGEQCVEHHKMLDRKQEKDNNRKATAEFKLRRRTLYNKKTTKQARKELAEQPSYQSNIGLNLDPNAKTRKKDDLTILNTINPLECKAVLADCETLLHESLTRPQLQPQNYDEKFFHYNTLVWDTETTTIGKSAEIIQITVMSSDEQFCFSEYITPTTVISQSASNIHGLTSKVVNGNTVMYKDGKEVLSFPLEESLTKLLNFIETIRNNCTNETSKPVISVMIGHNSSLFDTSSSPSFCGNKLCCKVNVAGCAFCG